MIRTSYYNGYGDGTTAYGKDGTGDTYWAYTTVPPRYPITGGLHDNGHTITASLCALPVIVVGPSPYIDALTMLDST